jgi:hypothetical protein
MTTETISIPANHLPSIGSFIQVDNPVVGVAVRDVINRGPQIKKLLTKKQ